MFRFFVLALVVLANELIALPTPKPTTLTLLIPNNQKTVTTTKPTSGPTTRAIASTVPKSIIVPSTNQTSTLFFTGVRSLLINPDIQTKRYPNNIVGHLNEGVVIVSTQKTLNHMIDLNPLILRRLNKGVLIASTKKTLNSLTTPITEKIQMNFTPVIETQTQVKTDTDSTPSSADESYNPNIIPPDIENLVSSVREESRGWPDFNVGEQVARWQPDFNYQVEELGSYNHGDLLHFPPMMFSRRRSIIPDLSFRWPKGVVHYNITYISIFTTKELKKLAAAMEEFHKHTCIRFEPYTGVEPDFISIESSNTGCWSTLGRVGGKQFVNLQAPNCLYLIGTVIHELMHALGFFHEQSRMDRDNSVNILWNNIISGKEKNFEKFKSFTYGLSYDHGSVMHYSANSFSKNNLTTIELKDNDKGHKMGQRVGFSNADIEKIRAMYKCIGPVSKL